MRLIDSDMLTSPELLRLPLGARWLWLGMILVADNNGYVRADTNWLRIKVMQQLRIKEASVRHWLGVYQASDMLQLCNHDGVSCYRIIKFELYQRKRVTRNALVTRDELQSHKSLPGAEIRIEEGEESDQKKERKEKNQKKRKKENSSLHLSRINHQEHTDRWNVLALEQNLPTIREVWNVTRQQHFKCRLHEYPNFWELVEEGIRNRGLWARENRFPKFDQVLQPSTFQKLIEGNYAEKGQPQKNLVQGDDGIVRWEE